MNNAESNESNLRCLNSMRSTNNNNFTNTFSGKRLYPTFSYGNNRESPDYLRLPNLPDNRFSYQNSYKFQKRQEIKIDKDLFGIVNQFSEKNNLVVSKNEFKFPEKKEQLNYKELIKPVIDSSQSGYLKNINDYSIKENYDVDESRFFKVNLKQKKNVYDIVSHTKNNFRPVEIKIDKWPKYYENYYALNTCRDSFKRKSSSLMKQAFLSNNIISSIEKSAGKESNNTFGNVCRKLKLHSPDKYPNINAFKSQNNLNAVSQPNFTNQVNNTEFDFNNKNKRFKNKK